VGGRSATFVGDGGPAAVVVDGLPPATELDVVVDGRRALGVRTLDPPAGRELFRFATVSDIHVGEGWTFGSAPDAAATRGRGRPARPPRRAGGAGRAEGWGRSTSS
jgi:hypothetical protein